MMDFFHMGGYGFYIWSSYALTAVILIIHVVLNQINHKKLLRDLLDAQHFQNQESHE